MHYSFQKTAFFFLFVILIAGFVLAQVPQSEYRIFGTVVDSKGKPVSGAKIVLKVHETGKQFTMKSNDEGKFDQQFIPHGIYSFSVEKEGYAPEKVETLDLSTTDKHTIQRKIDVTLRTTQEKAELLEKVQKQKEAMDLDQKLKSDYELGLKHLQEKKYDDAIAVMSRVSQLAPEAHGPYLSLAAAYDAKGDPDNAIVNYEKAIKIKADLVDPYIFLGSAYIKKKDYQKAIEPYKQYVNRKPEDAEAWCTLGNLHLAVNQDSEGETAVRTGLEKGPNVAQCHRVNADIQVRKGDTKGAIVSLKKYLELNPNAPDKASVAEMIKALEEMK